MILELSNLIILIPSRNGSYSSLSDACIEDGIFKFWIEIPLALGTVGGLTALHPLAKKSMELLGMPSASELMMITATVGLAQNFGSKSTYYIGYTTRSYENAFK